MKSSVLLRLHVGRLCWYRLFWWPNWMPTPPTEEWPATRLRISAVTIQTRNEDTIKAVSSEDQQEQATEKILLKPWVTNTESLEKQKTIQGMKQEIGFMKNNRSCVEVNKEQLTPEQQKNIIHSRWVLREKGNNLRARIVAKRYTETIDDMEDIYASTFAAAFACCLLGFHLRLLSGNVGSGGFGAWLARAVAIGRSVIGCGFYLPFSTAELPNVLR